MKRCFAVSNLAVLISCTPVISQSSQALSFTPIVGAYGSSRVTAVSGDGRVVVGEMVDAHVEGSVESSYLDTGAFRWTASGGVVGLGGQFDERMVS